MTTETLDTENKLTSTPMANVLVIDKENSFDFDLIYGKNIGGKPCRHDINQHTTQYDWNQAHTMWMAFGECDPIWLNQLLTAITEDSKIIFIDACSPGTYGLDKSECDALRPYIEKGKLQIITSGTPHKQAERFVELLDIRLMDKWNPVIPTIILNQYPDNLHILINTIGAHLNTKILSKNTLQVTTANFLKNALINAPLAYRRLPLKDLEINHQQKPVIIVAAGPSLNKQLPFLRANQDLFTILAVDTVWPILNKNGIIPDVILGIDSRSLSSWPINGLHPQTQLVVETGCSPELVWSHNANHAFTYANELIYNCLSKLDCHADHLSTGGSVATSAFELACRMGANPIVLIGQDLALTGGKDHAEGYPHKYSAEMLAARTKNGFDVEGYYPGKVRTERPLMMYKTWFEQRIREQPETMVINATEGGARIAGTYQLPFAQVCNEIKSTSLRKVPFEHPTLTQIDATHMQRLIDSLASVVGGVKNLNQLARQGLHQCRSVLNQNKKHSAKTLQKFDQLNDRIRQVDREIKFYVEVFGQRELETVTRDAHRAGSEMTAKREIELYKNIYEQIKATSHTALTMLGKVMDFYIKVQQAKKVDLSLIQEIMATE